MSLLFGSSQQPQNQQSSTGSLGYNSQDVKGASSFLQNGGLWDAAKLHPLAGLDRGVEYLDLEDDRLTDIEGAQGVIPSRSWNDDLCYGTGTVYLLGLGIGGLYGLSDGLANIPANAPPKLRLNTILNHITKRGPFLGNNAGVLAMSYNIVDAIIDNVRGKHDDFGSLASGAISGAFFRCASGVKPMAYSSLMMTAAAGSWCALKRFFD